jgi:hypothetical protein
MTISKRHLIVSFGWSGSKLVVPPGQISKFMEVLGHCEIVDEQSRYALPADMQGKKATKTGDFIYSFVESNGPELSYREFNDDILSPEEYLIVQEMGQTLHDELISNPVEEDEEAADS